MEPKTMVTSKTESNLSKTKISFAKTEAPAKSPLKEKIASPVRECKNVKDRIGWLHVYHNTGLHRTSQCRY